MIYVDILNLDFETIIIHATFFTRMKSPTSACVRCSWCSNNRTRFDKYTLPIGFPKIATDSMINHSWFLKTRLQALLFVLLGVIVIIMIFIVVVIIIIIRIAKLTATWEFCISKAIPWKLNWYYREYISSFEEIFWLSILEKNSYRNMTLSRSRCSCRGWWNGCWWSGCYSHSCNCGRWWIENRWSWSYLGMIGYRC